MTQFHTADNVFVDTDEGRFQLHVFTNDGEHLIVDIHADAVKFHDQVRREVGPWAAEADSARRAVAAGASLSEYLTGAPEVDPDAYAPDDPKHPMFHDTMSGIYDMRKGK